MEKVRRAVASLNIFCLFLSTVGFTSYAPTPLDTGQTDRMDVDIH